ncbi:MAG: putative repeat protein (TIGR01451 family), partial [Verrucomicrobiales bacterium]
MNDILHHGTAYRTKCFLLLVGLGLMSSSGARAAEAADGGLRVEVIAAYNLVVDSNVESPSTYAPRSAYLGAKFYNDGSNTLNDVFAFIGNEAAGTPGIYPARAHPPLVGPLPGSAFALTHEAGALGTADATRFLGSIAPGEHITVYWLISYPNLDELGNAVWGPSVKPDDDLWLEYDVWGTADEAGAPRSAAVTRTMTMRNEISAAANKILPNGVNKVPAEYLELLNQFVPSWTTEILSGSPGSQIVAEGVWYDLGNVGEGFDNDGDLTADHNAWMQPVGDPSQFDAGCFRLVHTYALVIVKLKGGGEEVYYTEDSLYFEHIPENIGAVGWVGYEVLPISGPCNSLLTPYQEVASGRDNEKFNGDYGAGGGIPIFSGSTALRLTKEADASIIDPGGTITYTVSYTNTGALALGDPALGLPVVLNDSIPPGTVYVAGSAIGGNVLPIGVSAYTTLYSTNNGVSWLTIEPLAAADVTDIQWWLSDVMSAGSAGVVRFDVVADLPYNEPVPLVTNTAGIGFGNGIPVLEASAVTLIRGNNSLGDIVYEDTNAGVEFANGLPDTGEPGISNITVTLYYDANSNQVVDASDVLFDTAITDTAGSYTFTELPDGHYVAAVDDDDAELPFGYTSTSPDTQSADLDSGGLEVNPVVDLNVDFGFAPVLSQVKNLVGGGPLYEGGQAAYTIDVFNRLPGTGTGQPSSPIYTAWASAEDIPNSGTGNKIWDNATNAFLLAEPEGSFARSPLDNANETLALTGFDIGIQSGSIVDVQVVIRLSLAPSYLAGDGLIVNLLDNVGATLFTTNYLIDSELSTGDFVIDVTTAKAWGWTDFGTNTSVQLLAEKGAGNSPGYLDLDAVALVVTSDAVVAPVTDAETLQPVPLVDTYDAGLLEFVSADPPVTSVTVTGVPPNQVGTITWANIGPIYPGGTGSIALTFNVLEPPSNTLTMVTNTADVTEARFLSGRLANPASSSVVTLLLPTGTIGDFIWRDLNGDGIQDGGTESGIAGVSVALTPPAGVDLGNGAGNPITNVTDLSGFYLFDTLPDSGGYTVTVLTATLPGGSGVNTFDEDGNNNDETVVTLDHDATDGSDTHLSADFGYQVPSTIQGLVWNDLNMNGLAVPDMLEPWLTNVTVSLFDSVGTFIASTTTDVGGYYEFTGAFNGDFTLTVDDASGPLGLGTWTQTFDSDGTGTPNDVVISVVTGGAGRADFSYYQTGSLSIGDTLFYDWDGNALQDAIDEGIANITVSLYLDLDADSLLDLEVDGFISSTVTDTNGNYLFEFLPAGNYLVAVDEADDDFPFAYTQTFDPDEPGVCTNCNNFGATTLTTTNVLTMDFAYRPVGSGSIGDTVWRDLNGDGILLGLNETGIANVEVSLLVDVSGDGSYSLLSVISTDVNGRYLFSGLPDGLYQVMVDTADSDLPMDAFGDRFLPTTLTRFDVVVAGGLNYLNADFGFAALGAIGDTIYWDANFSGSQDWGESGISNVTVRLYEDVNTNALYDVGTDLLVDTQVTDANGIYLFTMLLPDFYVVEVDAGGPIAFATLTGDPDSDGIPCGTPGSTNCDSQVGTEIAVRQNFMGADFGYLPQGVIGDTVWVDVNNDGLRDSGEPALAFITVEAKIGGVTVAQAETDIDGYYFFVNLPDGTYTVEVDTLDPDFPTTIVQSFDPDGLLDDRAVPVVLSGGVITQIGSSSVTNADLDVDFGYRYAGTNVLSGTVGVDGLIVDGVLSSGPSGVDPDEAPFEGEIVYLYLWNDDGDNIIESGETTFVASRTTDSLGDYVFTGLPDGDGDDRYVVSLAAPLTGLSLTTTTGNTPALLVAETTNLAGETLSARQVVSIVPVTANIDFAFELLADYDFGDLPTSYSTGLAGTPSGARHRVPLVPTLYLGATVDTEPNGQVSSDATGDGLDEDGVIPLLPWSEGLDGGNIQVDVGAGSGWLVGWIDFDQNGALTGVGEMIVVTNVSSSGGVGGIYTIAFDVPVGALSTARVFNARFRL